MIFFGFSGSSVQIKGQKNTVSTAGFIEEIECASWLANIVSVKKMGSQIRICMDFQDLNKACPMDEFPLPNVDILVDAAAGHKRFSFMDGYNGYNQIFMELVDASKLPLRNLFLGTTFIK